MTPALNSLDSQSKAINSMIEGTGPFFNAATPALVSLGDFGDRARTLFPAIRPLIADLNELGQPLTRASEFRPVESQGPDKARLAGIDQLHDRRRRDDMRRLACFDLGPGSEVPQGCLVRFVQLLLGPEDFGIVQLVVQISAPRVFVNQRRRRRIGQRETRRRARLAAWARHEW